MRVTGDSSSCRRQGVTHHAMFFVTDNTLNIAYFNNSRDDMGGELVFSGYVGKLLLFLAAVDWFCVLSQT